MSRWRVTNPVARRTATLPLPRGWRNGIRLHGARCRATDQDDHHVVVLFALRPIGGSAQDFVTDQVQGLATGLFDALAEAVQSEGTVLPRAGLDHAIGMQNQQIARL